MDPDNNKKNNCKEIAFIVCTNNKYYWEECQFYINQLLVPEGMKVSLAAIENAGSMTSGYNEGMRKSNAKYKVYLHQDVFIINPHFIYDMITCFQENPSVGMIGVAGTKRLPVNADVWKSLDTGGCCSIGTFSGAGYIAVWPGEESEGGSVDYVDGMLMATVYDVEWDERIDGFHFYDVSQCVRFREQGFQLYIPQQKECWVFHDFGPLNLETYQINRERFCSLYPQFGYRKEEEQDNTNIYSMCAQVANVLKPWFAQRRFFDILQTLQDVGNAIFFNQELLIIFFVLEIYMLERSSGVNSFVEAYSEHFGYESVERKFHTLKWQLIRVEAGYKSIEDMAEIIINQTYSIIAVIVMAIHNVPDQGERFLEQLGRHLQQVGHMDGKEWQDQIDKIKEYEKEHVPSADNL